MRPLMVKTKGQITIPDTIRTKLGLNQGDMLKVELKDNKIILSPTRLIPKEQEYFWTKEWQAKEI